MCAPVFCVRAQFSSSGADRRRRDDGRSVVARRRVCGFPRRVRGAGVSFLGYVDRGWCKGAFISFAVSEEKGCASERVCVQEHYDVDDDFVPGGVRSQAPGNRNDCTSDRGGVCASELKLVPEVKGPPSREISSTSSAEKHARGLLQLRRHRLLSVGERREATDCGGRGGPAGCGADGGGGEGGAGNERTNEQSVTGARRRRSLLSLLSSSLSSLCSLKPKVGCRRER